MASPDTLRATWSWLGLALGAAALAGACTLDTAGGLVPIGTNPTSVGGSGGAPTTTSSTSVGMGGDISSTSSSIGMTTTTSTSSVGGMGGMGGMGGDGGMGGSPPTGYAFRRPITVTASPSGAPADYEVYVDVSHQALISSGKSLASGDDLRVVHDDGAGNLTELPRALDPEAAYGTTMTRLWFNLQEPLAADVTDDDSYYLYYGDPAAGAPPADPEQVFLVFDEFDGATIDPAWTLGSVGDDVANDTIALDGMGNLELAGGTGSIFQDNDDFVFAHRTIPSGDVAIRARVEAAAGAAVTDFSFLGGAMIRQNLNDDARFHLASPIGQAFAANNRSSTYRTSAGNNTNDDFVQTGAPRVPVVVETARVGTTTFALYSEDAGFSFSVIGNTVTQATWSNPFQVGVVLSTNDNANTGTVKVDWVLVRRRVLSSPNTSLALPEETGPFPL